MTGSVCRSVVIGTDFGESAGNAIRWVGRHLAPGADQIVVHVVTPDPASSMSGPVAGADVSVRSSRQAAEDRFASLLTSTGDVRSRWEIREGEITTELVRVAYESEADLIVLGGNGRDRLVGEQVGTTAERLVHDSPVPVLVTSGTPADCPRALLVAVDGSEAATCALRWARVFSNRPGISVAALHSLSLFGTDLLQRVVRSGSVRQEEELHLEKWRSWLRQRVLAGHFSPSDLRLRVVLGDPPGEILAAAHEFADLVVMGDHGTGDHRGASVGSVTRAVLRGAPCPVIVVPDPRKQGVIGWGSSAGSPVPRAGR